MRMSRDAHVHDAHVRVAVTTGTEVWQLLAIFMANELLVPHMFCSNENASLQHLLE